MRRWIDIEEELEQVWRELQEEPARDDLEQVVDADPAPQPTYAPPTPPPSIPFSDRLGRALAWLGLALGLFLAFGALALWAVIALAAGFVAWLISMAVIGAVVVAMLFTVTFTLIRPKH